MLINIGKFVKFKVGDLIVKIHKEHYRLVLGVEQKGLFLCYKLYCINGWKKNEIIYQSISQESIYQKVL